MKSVSGNGSIKTSNVRVFVNNYCICKLLMRYLFIASFFISLRKMPSNKPWRREIYSVFYRNYQFRC